MDSYGGQSFDIMGILLIIFVILVVLGVGWFVTKSTELEPYNYSTKAQKPYQPRQYAPQDYYKPRSSADMASSKKKLQAKLERLRVNSEPDEEENPGVQKNWIFSPIPAYLIVEDTHEDTRDS